MKKWIQSTSLVCTLLIFACSKEFELKKSVFIPDPDFPDLPAYSEWGYNTFGAYYDRELFLYNDQEVPAKVISTGGNTSFLLKGQKGSYSYYYGNNDNEMSIAFSLPDFLPENYSDLVGLDETTFDLTNPGYQILVRMETDTFEVEVLQGKLEFKKARQLMVDTDQIEVILSGYFAFQALVDGEPVSVTDGRFDVGIGEDNFFKY